MSNNLQLMAARRFCPLFWTQFGGALNDNLIKNALVMLITYRIGEQSGYAVSTLLSIQTALFILPFFLFSALAGQIADKYSKSDLARWIKLAEIGLGALAAIGLVMQSLWFLMAVLFLFGVHSAFFGPIKYAILPELLEERELLTGNGLVEAGTLIAILVGTIIAGLFTLSPYGTEFIAALIILIAYAGYWMSREIPYRVPSSPNLAVDWNVWRDTAAIIRRAAANRNVAIAIIAISWFWFLGAAFVTLLPAMVKYQINANQEVVTFLFVIFSIGIAAGSVICSKIMRGKIGTSIVPWAALGVSAFCFDLWYVIGQFDTFSATAGFGQFIDAPQAWRIAADFAGLTICGGLFIVPLYTVLQHYSPAAERARMMAANNIGNALFMVLSSIMSLQLIHSGFAITDVFALYAGVNLLAGIWLVSRWRI